MPKLYISNRVVTDLIVLFGLVIKHDKLEIFYFSRVHNNSNPELNFSEINTSTLKLKTYWRYLGFYFDWCLFFKKHVYYYSTKVLFTIKVMSMLRNSIRGLLLSQKQLLYCSYIVLIVIYSFQLQFFARAPTKF